MTHTPAPVSTAYYVEVEFALPDTDTDPLADALSDAVSPLTDSTYVFTGPEGEVIVTAERLVAADPAAVLVRLLAIVTDELSRHEGACPTELKAQVSTKPLED